jgi:hypothetical protein
MPLTANDNLAGPRGAPVAWHPVQQKYYAAFAGNIKYPMAVFDAKGKRLFADAFKTQFDIRGMWYDAKRKKILTNGYEDFDWASYVLDTKRLLTQTEAIFEGADYQPDVQSVGTYPAALNKVMFLYGRELNQYNAADGSAEPGTIVLHPGITETMAKANNESGDEDITEDYNKNAVSRV